MICYEKQDVELIHLIEELHKGVPIIKAVEFEAQNYKYGKEIYFNVIKKQIDNSFYFTSHYAMNKLNIELDEYVGRYCLDPESKTEINALNELLEYLQKNTIENEQSTNNTKTISSTFTALQWSAIFYYVEPDIYGEIQQKKDKLEKFRKDFNVSKSQFNLSNKHSEIVRITNGDEKNELKQKHIDAIKKILPYLEKKHVEAFKNASDDLSILIDDLDRK